MESDLIVVSRRLLYDFMNGMQCHSHTHARTRTLVRIPSIANTLSLFANNKYGSIVLLFWARLVSSIHCAWPMSVLKYIIDNRIKMYLMPLNAVRSNTKKNGRDSTIRRQTCWHRKQLRISIKKCAFGQFPITNPFNKFMKACAVHRSLGATGTSFSRFLRKSIYCDSRQNRKGYAHTRTHTPVRVQCNDRD